MSLHDDHVVECKICGTTVARSGNLRWRKDGFDILECPTCGVRFRAQLPTPDELRKIYGPAYFVADAGDLGGQGYSDYLAEEENHRANAAARVALLERERAPGRLLDVGCAAGFFLDEARRRGWAVKGVELAPTMVGYARTKLELDVDDVSFADLDAGPGSFDAVTMWDYIEHSTDPMGDFRRAATLLEPEGLLALSTGDAASAIARLSGSRWHLLTPRHHNFFFTRAVLERALRDAGFDVVRTTYRGSLYSVHYLVHKLRTLADVPLAQRAAAAVGRSRVGKVALPVNLWDIVTIVARRSVGAPQ